MHLVCLRLERSLYGGHWYLDHDPIQQPMTDSQDVELLRRLVCLQAEQDLYGWESR
jgi:hypothetical protein